MVSKTTVAVTLGTMAGMALLLALAAPVSAGTSQEFFASIFGVKYDDLNANGVRDPGEPGLNGWTIRAFDDDGEAGSAVTAPCPVPADGDGCYRISGLFFTTYSVCEDAQANWFQSQPASGACHVIDTSNDFGPGVGPADFGNYRHASVIIMKFEDVNGDGVVQGTDPPINDWHMGVFEAGGPLIVDGFTGEQCGDGCAFFNVKPGSVEICEDFIVGWIMTVGGPGGCYDVELSSGEFPADFVFANFELGAVHGQKFHDLNGDGVRDPGEPGLNDWEICLLVDDPPYPVEECTVTHSMDFNGDNVITPDEVGWYWFEGVRPAAFVVCETRQDGWTQTFPTTVNVIPDEKCHAFVLSSGEVLEGLDFGNANNIGISGTKFNDLRGDGVRHGYDPPLPGWEICLHAAGAGEFDPPVDCTTTDAQGKYSFDNVPFADYTVRESLKPGWVQTFPAGIEHVVTGGGAETHANLDFGNFKLAKIVGHVLSDPNGDGNLADKQPLGGWQVTLTTSGGGPVGMTPSGPDGKYEFVGLRPGTYHVDVEQRSGWMQTQPQPIPPGRFVVGTLSGFTHGFHDFVFRPQILDIEVTTDKPNYWAGDGNDILAGIGPFGENVQVIVTATQLGMAPAAGVDVHIDITYASGNGIVDAILAGTGCETHSDNGVTNAAGVVTFDVPAALIVRCLGLGLLDLAELPTDLLNGQYTVHATGSKSFAGPPIVNASDMDTTTYTVQTLPPPLPGL
jgi:hypothetical protein